MKSGTRREGLRADVCSSGEGRQAGGMGGDAKEIGWDRAPPGREGGLEKGRWGSRRRHEGQVWADVEEMRAHGGEEERREVMATGVGVVGGADRRGEGGGGESPSPVEASSHEGLKVDGAGERWEEGRAQTERRREAGGSWGCVEGEAGMVGWVWYHGGRDAGRGMSRMVIKTTSSSCGSVRLPAWRLWWGGSAGWGPGATAVVLNRGKV